MVNNILFSQKPPLILAFKSVKQLIVASNKYFGVISKEGEECVIIFLFSNVIEYFVNLLFSFLVWIYRIKCPQ